MLTLESFLDAIKTATEQSELVRLTLAKPRAKSADLQNVYFRLVQIKGQIKTSATWRYQTRDETHNYSLSEVIPVVQELLSDHFMKADLFSLSGDWSLSKNKKGRYLVTRKPASQTELPTFDHDHSKQYVMDFRHKDYFKSLGVLTASGEVKQDKFDKFRQVNKYIEIMDGLLADLPVEGTFHVADMGSGSGYLSFALYDFLVQQYAWDVRFQGIELRSHLVDKCNEIAKANQMTGLEFHQGTIADFSLPKLDLLIALHACDTATDDAIVRGIHQQARVIVCAPCCHKALRLNMASGKLSEPKVDYINTITKHGILLERQAELLTDAIRALCLEVFGYKTRVFEFISSEHTGKNVMIVAEKRTQFSPEDQASAKAELEALKTQFGLADYYLETILDA